MDNKGSRLADGGRSGGALNNRSGEGASFDPDFFHQPVEAVARGLIGATLLVDGVGGRIVETEAYDSSDPASHSFRGQTAGNAAMFGPVARAYVYRIYGLHWCLNVVAGRPGSAVLIRALEPVEGIEQMIARRGVADPLKLCSGPGRLCQALAVDGSMNGASLNAPPFALHRPPSPVPILTGQRIGISRGVATAWRFGATGSRYLSRPFPA